MIDARHDTTGCHRSRRSSAIEAAMLTVAALAAVPAFSAGLLDAPWRAFDAGVWPSIGPSSIAAGDLDDDEIADLVVGLYFFGDPGIAVLIGNGDGTYGDLAVYTTGSSRSVGDVGLADIDGNGSLDVVATIPDANFQTRRVGYWRNNGDGTLAARREFATGGPPVGLAIGDFTGDGFPDVAFAENDLFGNGDTVGLLAHNGRTGGQAGFRAPLSFAAGSAPEVVRSGDLDDDGDLDLVVGRATGIGGQDGIAVLFNQGAGFSPPVFYDPGSGTDFRTAAIDLADVDLDGDLDLIGSAAGFRGYLSVRINRGDGTFGPAAQFQLAENAFRAENVAAADLNGDGRPDLVATTPTGRAGDGLHVLLSKPGGGFGPATFLEAAKQTWDLLLLDSDDDGDRDVLTVANDSAVVTVHTNPGDGRFLVLPRHLVGSISSGMDHADIDGDGDLDIATADSDVRILRNRGDGTFSAVELVDVPIDPGEVKLRDLDDDGDPDILVSGDPNSPPYHFAVSLNRGDGTFEPGVITFINASQAGDVEALDLDNDGLLDVALTDPGPAGLIYIAINSGDGVHYDLRPPLSPVGGPAGVGGADFDRDGNVDLVTSDAFGLSVYPGNGDGSFEGGLATGTSGYPFAVTDLDGDGNADLAFLAGRLTSSTEWVGTMLGYGDGTFQFPDFSVGPVGLESSFRISSDLDVGDLDRDGRPDVVLTSNAPNDLSVFRGRGDGTLEPQDRYGVGYSASQSVVGDFDGDRIVDVASMMSLPPGGFQDAVVVLFGKGPSGGLDLAVEGSCPGAMTLVADGAAPGAPVAFLGARGTGAVIVPPGRPCAGIELGLDGASLRLLGTATSGDDGRAMLDLTVPGGACGRAVVQAVDGGTCAVSDVEGL